MFDTANIYHIANTAKFLGDSVAFWDKMHFFDIFFYLCAMFRQ